MILAKCGHTTHKNSTFRFRVGPAQYDELLLAVGWNWMRHNWELCDHGLWEPKTESIRKRPHSKPRKNSQKRHDETASL